MRHRYHWYLPPSPEELEAIWESATVSVDANVLLDLYRYHDEARDQLLEALRSFSGRLLLTSQVADEFIENRTAVIAQTSAEYETAKKTIDDFRKALVRARDALRGHRMIPDTIADTLEHATATAISAAESAIGEARRDRPNFLKHDPVLQSIVDLFDNAVADPPPPEKHAELRQEAKRRREAKIPPGYMDSKKDGQRADGDYILWWEILEHARVSNRPMILVTSDLKEDWWEIHSGKRVGPRRELLQEAYRVTGQRVVILSTELFVERVAQRKGKELSQAILFEIQGVASHRHSAPDDERSKLERIVVDALDALTHDLIQEDPISSLIAETNASSFSADEIEVTKMGDLDLESAELEFEATIQFTGDQDEERMWYGDTISVTIQGTIGFDGSEWVIRDYDVHGDIDAPED